MESNEEELNTTPANNSNSPAEVDADPQLDIQQFILPEAALTAATVSEQMSSETTSVKFTDRDGDQIEFRLQGQVIYEYVNGGETFKTQVRKLRWNPISGMLREAGGYAGVPSKERERVIKQLVALFDKAPQSELIMRKPYLCCCHAIQDLSTDAFNYLDLKYPKCLIAFGIAAIFLTFVLALFLLFHGWTMYGWNKGPAAAEAYRAKAYSKQMCTVSRIDVSVNERTKQIDRNTKGVESCRTPYVESTVGNRDGNGTRDGGAGLIRCDIQEECCGCANAVDAMLQEQDFVKMYAIGTAHVCYYALDNLGHGCQMYAPEGDGIYAKRATRGMVLGTLGIMVLLIEACWCACNICNESEEEQKTAVSASLPAVLEQDNNVVAQGVDIAVGQV